MERTVIEEGLRRALERLGWRLKARPRHRLVIDLLSLFMGLRPLVMVDYMPQSSKLVQMLSTILHDVSKASSGLAVLKIMHMEDCIYVFHEANLEVYMKETLSSDTWLNFVVLDDGPARVASKDEAAAVLEQLKGIQTLLTQVYLCSSTPGEVQQDIKRDSNQVSCIDLEWYFRDVDIVTPTLNGWLLGYPVIYLFSKDKVDQARRCLSSGQLHLYQLIIYSVFSKQGPSKGAQSSEPEEILSFTVPSEVSVLGSAEPWAEAFMSHIRKQAGLSSISSGNLRLDVSSRTFQSVAF